MLLTELDDMDEELDELDEVVLSDDVDRVAAALVVLRPPPETDAPTVARSSTQGDVNNGV